jgi:pimeloyl-ACP methyl ester carboxylesterase
MDEHHRQAVDPPPTLWQQPPRRGNLPPWLNRGNILWCLGVMLVTLAVWLSGDDRRDSPAVLADAECWFDIPAGRTVACFRLRVPETRGISLAPAPETARGRMLELPVVVIYTTVPVRAMQRDPVVYLSGGPGDGAWIDPERIDWWWDFIAANDWLATRDVVLFDQRGSGIAAGDMDCPDAQQEAMGMLAVIDPAVAARLQLQAARKCAATVLQAGHNAAAYTSLDGAEDLHELFLALGGRRWNVYGLSYGTRLALEYMRRHPGDIRAVILDSVLPPQAQLIEDDAANADRSFRQLFSACRQEPSCDPFYGDLGRRLLDLVERLNAVPLVETRPHPAHDAQVTVRMDGNRLLYRLYSYLYNRADIEMLPRIIDAYDRNLRGEVLADLDNFLWEVFGRATFGDAMFMASQCFEEMPFNDAALADAAYARFPLLRAIAREEGWQATHSACEVWRETFTVTEARRSDNEPVISDLPTLLLAGSFDPVTPPDYARMAASTLANSHFYEFAHYGHDVLGNAACANELAGIFLAAPGVKPWHQCVDYETSPSFRLPSQ